MDDVIAVAVKLRNRQLRFFLTWGRTFDPVDGSRIAAIVLDHAGTYALGGTPVSAQVCYSLQDAAHTPYFHEALFRLRLPDQLRLSQGDASLLRRWRARIAREQSAGKHLHFCGDPQQRERCREAFWSMRQSQGR